jgi:hypothetical protein
MTTTHVVSAKDGDPLQRKEACFPTYERLFPSGWFAACLLSELPNNGVLFRTLLGHPTLLTRTPAGEPLCARVPSRWVDALRNGTWQGSRLVGSGLVLRSHGSSLIAEGGGSAGIEVLPVRAFMGVLLLWHAADGSTIEPFSLPEWSSELVTPYRFRYFPRMVNTTVQEITEDIADTYHYGPGGHRWSELLVHELDTSTDICTLEMSFTLETSIFGRFKDRIRFDGHFEAIGVGLFIGSVRSQLRDLDTRPLICYTPTASPRQIQLIYGESHRRIQAPSRLSKLLGLLPRRLVDHLVSIQSLRAMDKDVEYCDVRRWETEKYLRARRERTDHLLQDCRRWVSRFYTEAPRPAAETESAS